jgi:hypothetical protein
MVYLLDYNKAIANIKLKLDAFLSQKLCIITHVKFHWNPTSSLICNNRKRFFYNSKLWRPFCAAKRNVPVLWCTTMVLVLITPEKCGWNQTSSLICEGRTRISYVKLWRPFCAGKRDLPVMCIPGIVLVTLVKFGWKPTGSLTCEDRTRFFYF